jgi:hypothetical protein
VGKQLIVFTLDLNGRLTRHRHVDPGFVLAIGTQQNTIAKHVHQSGNTLAGLVYMLNYPRRKQFLVGVQTCYLQAMPNITPGFLQGKWLELITGRYALG